MRTIVFFDGQNLFHLAKGAWAPRPLVPGSPYGWPSYDVEKLAAALVARDAGRTLDHIRFYTGVANPAQSVFWRGFWSNKLRYLRGRVNPGGPEKGVDVSLAIDVIRLTYEQRYDVAILISQDWDFGPAVRLAKRIAREQPSDLGEAGSRSWITPEMAHPAFFPLRFLRIQKIREVTVKSIIQLDLEAPDIPSATVITLTPPAVVREAHPLPATHEDPGRLAIPAERRHPMRLRPLGRSPPALQARYHRGLKALDGPTADEQLEVACQLVVGILKAARLRFEGSQEDRAAYDSLCEAVEEWFETEIPDG